MKTATGLAKVRLSEIKKITLVVILRNYKKCKRCKIFFTFADLLKSQMNGERILGAFQ